MRIFFLIFFLPILGFPLTLKDIFSSSKKGDYVVIEQDKNYTLFMIKENTDSFFVVEEINIPTKMMKEKNFKIWIEKKAPLCTSWTCYLLDKKKNKPLESFSYLRNEKIALVDEMSIFSKLFDLELKILPENKRKKIGAPPLGGNDHRSFWSPPTKINGSKAKNVKYIVYRTKWTEDSSELSGKIIDLYFTQNPFLPLPVCILVQGDHLRILLRTVDAGNNLQSPQKNRFNLLKKPSE